MNILRKTLLLKKLNFSSTLITASGVRIIARLLQTNETIQKICISNNNISYDGAAAISDYLKNNNTLQELNMSNASIASEEVTENDTCDKEVHNNFSLDNTFQYDILTADTRLINIFHVNKLDISSNTLSSTIISSCIRNNEYIQELNISHNQLTSDGARQIANAITANSKLQKLDISNNYITSKGLMCLLKTNNTVLQFLNISYSNVTESEFKQIEQLIKTSTFPLKVCASWNQIVLIDGDLKIKTKIFQNNILSDMKEDVWLPDMILNSHYRVEFLSNCLKEDDWLRKLNLCNQNINSVGAKLIANAIDVNTTLLILDISCNTLSDEGAVAISECLKMNNVLQELNLSKNEITSVGATRIAKALEKNRTLQKLDISCNTLSDEGAAAISECLKTNNVLVELSLAENEISSKGAMTIVEAMSFNRTLIKLNILCNPLSESIENRISIQLRMNKEESIRTAHTEFHRNQFDTILSIPTIDL